MTATIVSDAVPVTGTRLAYKAQVLDANHDAMVERLVSHHHFPRPRAEAMIDQWWDRLVNRLVEDCREVNHPHSLQGWLLCLFRPQRWDGAKRELAERIMNEALGFLYLCSFGGGYGPSLLVDRGWHKLLEYTFEYDCLSHTLCGRFLHHLPTDVVGFSASDHQAKKPAAKHCTHCSGRHCVHCTGTISSADNRLTPVTGSRPLCGMHCGGMGHCINGRSGWGTDSTLPDYTIADTVAAMMLLGPVDKALWFGKGDPDPDECKPCHQPCEPELALADNTTSGN